LIVNIATPKARAESYRSALCVPRELRQRIVFGKCRTRRSITNSASQLPGEGFMEQQIIDLLARE
jgi:hypothetical protein